MNKIRGTYQRVEKDYTLSVDYTYYWWQGDYTHPPESELEVTEAYIDSELLPLEFYYDFIHDQIEEGLQQDAHDQR